MSNNLLDQVKKNNVSLDNTISRLEVMFFNHPPKIGTNKIGGVVFDKTIDLDTIYENETVSVTRGVWHKKGSEFPLHAHKDSVEFLVCVQGKFIVKFEYGVRLMSRGECLSIPSGISHLCIALEDESIMIATCVPPEPAYLLKTNSKAD